MSLRVTTLQDAVAAISQMKRGTVVSHLVLANLLKTHPQSSEYYQAIVDIKPILINEHSIFLVSKPNKGYEIKARGLEIKVVEKEFVSGANRIIGAVQKSKRIDLDGITDNELRNQTIESASKMQATAAFLRNSNLVAKKASELPAANPEPPKNSPELPPPTDVDGTILSMKRDGCTDIEVAQLLSQKTGVDWIAPNVAVRYNQLLRDGPRP